MREVCNLAHYTGERREHMKYAKLRGRIYEKFKTQSAFAEATGMNRTTLSHKLVGNVDWTRSDIELLAQALDLTAEEIVEYFFTL